MRRFLFLLGLAAIISASCSKEETVHIPDNYSDGIVFRLTESGFENENPESKSTGSPTSGEYDKVIYYIMDSDGAREYNIKSSFRPSTSELKVTGLIPGEYSLVVLAIKGDENEDNATIHDIENISDVWISFPETGKPLNAEYFYSRTPFTVSIEDTPSGKMAVSSVSGEIRQKRIVGKLSFSFDYNNDYVRTAVTSRTAAISSQDFFSEFSADSLFSGRKTGGDISLSIDGNDSYIFLPSASSEGISGSVSMESRRYTGDNISQTYKFSGTCIGANRITQVRTDVRHPDDESGTLFITETAYEEGSHTKILQDGESKEIYADSRQRSFNTANPLQVGMSEDNRLHLRFYSPRDLHDVSVRAVVPDVMEDTLTLAYFDRIPGFADIFLELPMLEKDVIFRTGEGKTVSFSKITPEQTGGMSFFIESGDEYWSKLKKIVHGWNISFGLYNGDPDLEDGGPSGNWKGIRPVHCREAVAVFLNFTFMVDMDEHEQILKENIDKLYDDNKQPVTPEKVLAQMRQTRSLTVGLINTSNGVLGLGGGSAWGVYQQAYLQHYWNTYSCEIMFHELGHCMGYGHNSSFTYGPWAGELMNNFYVNNLHLFPIDSPSYLNSSSNPTLYKN